METFSIPVIPAGSVANVRWTDKFERQAQLDPANSAIVSGEQTMSYDELNRRSNQIANLLRESEIGRGSFVGLGLHRCLELPAALIGILKSGAAYVPLDPGYPAARIQQIIESAQLTHVITQQELAGQFPQVKLICIDTPTHAHTSATDPFVRNGEDDFINAIRASGSTGRSKGATVNQSGFGNSRHWYSIQLHLGPCDPTLVISSPSFDLTQRNFFDPLATGGTLILDDCQTYDIPRISSLILQHGITLIHCTPSAFYPLVNAAAADDFRALATIRFAVLGGEPISIPRLRSWLESPGCGAEVLNSYGPTECMDLCASYRLHKGNLDDFPLGPQGGEIPNVRVSTRDESLRPLPDGVIGEPCISGAGIGGGEVNNLSRTAQVLNNGIYRIGDLTTEQSSNILDFRCRADEQVKVTTRSVSRSRLVQAGLS